VGERPHGLAAGVGGARPGPQCLAPRSRAWTRVVASAATREWALCPRNRMTRPRTRVAGGGRATRGVNHRAALTPPVRPRLAAQNFRQDLDD
jgi:hypothetical protein